MLFRKNLHINESIKSSLAKIRISEFQDFMNYSAGKLVSRPSKRHVRTLYLDVAGRKRKYFLKKTGIPSPQEVLKALCRLWPLHSDTSHELLLLELFRDQGIPVMNPLAWGGVQGSLLACECFYFSGKGCWERICRGLSSCLVTKSSTFNVGTWRINGALASEGNWVEGTPKGFNMHFTELCDFSEMSGGDWSWTWSDSSGEYFVKAARKGLSVDLGQGSIHYW